MNIQNQTNNPLISVLDYLDKTVYIADVETYELLYVNDKLKKVLGKSFDKGAKCWQVIFKRQTGPCTFCTNAKLLTPEGIPGGKQLWKYRDRLTNCWYEIEDRAIYWYDGRIAHLHLGTDITELQKAQESIMVRETEARLKESRESYRTLFESAPVGIAITTLDGRLLAFNSAFMKLLGSTDRNHFAALGMPQIYRHAEDWNKMVERLKEKDQIENYEQYFKDAKNRVITVSMSLRRVQYAGETCIQTIVRDVTNIKRMEAAFRDYTENLAKMVDEKTIKLTFANKELTAAIKSLEEMRQQLSNSAYHAGIAEIAVSVLHNIGNVINSLNVRICSLSEKTFHREIQSLKKIHHMLQTEIGNGIPDGEMTFERQQKLVQFLSTNIEIMTKKHAEHAHDLDFIRNGVNHIIEIIAIQQKYAGLKNFESRVNINDLLKDATDMMKDALAKRGIDVDVKLGNIPEIVIDKNRFIQIFINLIKNAYEAIDMAPPENPKRIWIETAAVEKKAGDFIRTIIGDTGIGVSSEIRNDIFKFQFSTKQRGTGFGLHDCENYIKKKEGVIELLSEGIGKGARIVIDLPVPRGAS